MAMIRDSGEVEEYDELERLALLYGIGLSDTRGEIRRKLQRRGVEVSDDD